MEAKNDQSMRAIRKRNTAMKLANDSSAHDTPVFSGSAKQLKIRERNWKNSRKSRSGHKRGLPKKGGAGGKGVWGKLGSELSEETEDENDPNYDPQSEDDRNVQLKVIIPELSRERFQSKGEGIIFEYFQHGNTHEAESAFEEILATIPFRYWIVELAVDVALDHKPSHCELISVLISDLYGSILNHDDIAQGFDALLSNINELKLDVPEIDMYLGNFIVRAIADDCLAPRFVDDAKLKYASNQIAIDTLTRCANMINVENCYAHMDDVWGVAGICGQRPVNFVIRQMVLIIKEFVESNDCNDSLERLRQLEVPHFHHEFVYEAVLMAIESLKNDDRVTISRLLKHFENAGILTPDHLEKGFERVFNDMPDICLDIPLAYVTLEQFISVCQKDGFLSESIIKRVPNKGRKRYVSEGDGGKLKNEIPLSQ